MQTLYVQPIRDSYVSALEPDKSFGEDGRLLVGKYATNCLRSYVQFDLSNLPDNITITAASMKLYLLENPYPNVEKTVGVYPVIQPWEEEITFTNQPLFEEVPSAHVNITNEVNTFISWNISDLVKDWHSGSLANYGITLDCDAPWVAFASSNAADISKRVKPILEIQYQPVLFSSQKEQGLATTDQIQYSLARDISGARQVSFFVNNVGVNQATVQLEVSPDGDTYMVESDPVAIPSNESTILVPRFFVQYARVGYKSAPGAPTTLNIWFQTQSY